MPRELGETGVNAVGQSSLGGAALQAIEHFLLNINRDDSAGRTDTAGEFQGEKTHARTRFEDGLTVANVGGEDVDRFVLKPADGRNQEIANPPRTDAMTHLCLEGHDCSTGAALVASET